MDDAQHVVEAVWSQCPGRAAQVSSLRNPWGSSTASANVARLSTVPDLFSTGEDVFVVPFDGGPQAGQIAAHLRLEHELANLSRIDRRLLINVSERAAC